MGIYLLCELFFFGADRPLVELLHRVGSAPASAMLQVNVRDPDGMADRDRVGPKVMKTEVRNAGALGRMVKLV